MNYTDEIIKNGVHYSIASKVLTGEGQPSTSLEGIFGQFYIDITNKKSYQCFGLEDADYIWKETGSGAGAQKQILLSLKREKIFEDPEDKESYLGKKGILYLKLLGFSEVDIGKKIYLYRMTKHGQRYYKHPANYDVARKDTGAGFATVAGTRMDKESGKTWAQLSSVDDVMINDGYIQTEWIITQEDIERGYIAIDIGHEWIPLCGYSDSEGHWQFLSSTKIKFGLINEGNLEYMSEQFIRISITPESNYEAIFWDTEGNANFNLQAVTAGII